MRLEELERLKESLNNVINKKMTDRKRRSLVNEVRKSPLNVTIGIFEEITPMLMEKGHDGDMFIRKYLKTIKNDKTLKEAYGISYKLKKPSGVGNADTFVREAVSLCENRLGNATKLGGIVAESLAFLDLDYDTLSDIVSKSKTKINESIDYVLTNRLTSSNVKKWSNNIDIIKEHVEKMSENEKVRNSATEALKSEIGDGVCEQWKRNAYKSITEWEKGKDLSGLFEEYKKMCEDTIDNVIESKGIEEKARLTGIRKSVSDKSYNPDTIVEDILRMSELNEVLLG